MRSASAGLVAALLALTSGASPAAPSPTAPAAPAPASDPLDALIAPSFPGGQPGAAVLVRKGDKVLLRKGYGAADLAAKLAVKPDMVFRLGSITKQFTAAAIMILADAHKLSLGDDLRKWVPEYPDHHTPITLEHLLTHTAGVPSYTDQPGFGAQSRKDLSHEQLLAIFKDLPLEFPPGSKWDYSNSGYYLLGLVIEKASGKTYAQFMTDAIFAPLGMAQTRYGDKDPLLPGGVRGYARHGKEWQPAEAISMKPPFAAGALVSTVDDLARWDSAIAAGKLLTKASWQRVFTPMKLADGSSSRYGFGWNISDFDGRPLQTHGGGIPGFNTTILRMPQEQVLVAILCNSLPAPIDLNALALRLAALAIGKPIVDPPVVKVAPALLDRYAGVYSLAGTRSVLIRRADDHLSVQMAEKDAPIGPPLDALPASDTHFFIKNKPARLTFVSDPKTGQVTGIDTIRSDGSSAKATRTDQPLPAERVALDPAQLERHVGKYELSPGFVLAITREGARLFAQATGQPRVEIFATSPTEFFLKVVEAQLSFFPDPKGPTPRLVLHQNGRDVPGKRVP